jgi:hypothetical protein
MNRTASIFAIGGILTAAICLPLAALMHRDGARPWRWESITADWNSDGPTRNGGPIVSRDFTWDGSDRVEFDGSGDLHFHPAPTWHLSVRGPEHTLDRLRVGDGRIRLHDSGFFHWDSPDHLDIQLSGPDLQQIAVNGSGSITLDDLKQEKVDIHIRGSGSALAHGSVESLHLEIAGSGSAQLEGLAAKDAYVRIAGSGDADIASTESADVSIAGSGDVRLHGSPRRLSSHVAGSGRVVNVVPAS